MKKFNMKHISNNGDIFTCEVNDVELLDYKALLKTKNEKKTDLRLVVCPTKIHLNGIHIKNKYDTVTITGWTPPHKQTIYALTIGGWQPFSFLNNGTILADRNVIDRIKKISEGKKQDHFIDTNWWFSLYKNTGLTINPILYALEGNRKSVPSFQEFCNSFEEAGIAIESSIPGLKTIRYTQDDYKNVYTTFVEDFSTFKNQEIKFLCDVMPLLWKTQKTNILGDIEREINNKAKVNGIYGRLSHIATLDVLYEDTSGKGKSLGRGILKPHQTYTKENAYNAISDLHNLELLLQFSRVFDNVFFCTADYYLAAFWVAMGMKNVSYKNGNFSMEIALDHLFSRSKGLRLFE